MREFLRAYLRSQDAHKELHRLLKAFETDATTSELKRRLAEVQATLAEVDKLIAKAE